MMRPSRTQRAVKQGGFVAANHIAGVALALVTAVVCSRTIGPRAFAVVALCGSISGVARIVGRLGINAFLITRVDNPTDREYRVALGGMLYGSLGAAVIACLLLPAIGRVSNVPHLLWPGLVTMSLLPLYVVSLPAMSRLERNLEYRRIIEIELSSQLLGSVVGIVLLLCGAGVWGLVIGWIVRAFIIACLPWVFINMVPRAEWDGPMLYGMLQYGTRYSVATSVDQLRNVVMLVVVGRVLGGDAVGLLELSFRAVRCISPFRAAIGRVAVPAMAVMFKSRDRVNGMLLDLIEVEMLCSVPVTLAAVWVFPFCLRHILPAAWSPTIIVFPWLAAASLLLAAHASVLNVLHIGGGFRVSILSNLLSLVFLSGLVWLLGRRFGLEGCAAATVAAWPTMWVREWAARKTMGTKWSRHGVAWALCGATACLSIRFGAIMLVPAGAILLLTQGAVRKRAQLVLAAYKG
jgi:O-antigen/teichoic acid export membrane protein